jgi:hypothetical protein
VTRNEALSYFVSRGWTVPQAAGIVANLVAESNLNPAAVGDGGLAYGVAQWHPDRQEGFYRFFGRSIQGSSVEDQLAWVDEEFRTTERSAGTALRACTTAYDAGACVSAKYERPADRAGEMAKRGKLAESIAREYVAPEPLLEHEQTVEVSVEVDTQPAAPIEERSETLPPKQPEKHMGALALLQLFGPILSNLIPQISPLLGAKGEKVTQYAGVAKTVLDTITEKTGAANLQGAVEAMSADPAVKAAVQAAVVSHPDVIGFMEVGGGVPAARASALTAQNSDRPFWFNPAFWVSLILLVFPMMLCVDAFFVHPAAYQAELRTQIVTGVLAVIMIVGGFWLGTSFGSQRKTELAAQANSDGKPTF